jgi:hypothetical protein
MEGRTENKQRDGRRGRNQTKENRRRDINQTQRMEGGTETKQIEWKERQKPNKEN